MRRFIVIIMTIMLLLTGCGNNADNKNAKMLSEVSCGETIKQQLDALVYGGDIGYRFEGVNGIVPMDLYNYISYRAVDFFSIEDEEYILCEDECRQILSTDFGIDYIPFQYEGSPEYTVLTGARSDEAQQVIDEYTAIEISRRNGISYIIKEASENEGCVTVVAEKKVYTDKDEKCYLTQRVKYSFNIVDNISTILGAEII